MSYFYTNRDDEGNQGVFAEGTGADAFGRMRVSNPYQLFSYKPDFNPGDHLFFSVTATGGTVTHEQSNARHILAVTSSNGSRALRRSRAKIPYQPGKSILAVMSGVMGSGQANTVKRIGMFDDNNGVYFELDGTTKYVCIRSSVSGATSPNRITQSSWNLDKLDGTGPSGLTVDWTKTQIFVIDWQWLGVGRVRVGFDISGEIHYCHEFLHANVLSIPWSATPNLPVSYEIINTGAASGTSNLHMICQNVTSEGGFDNTGTSFSINNLVNRQVNTLRPIFLLRARSGRAGAPIALNSVDVISNGANTILWALILNPTISGVGTAPSYNSVHSDSNFEFDVACTQSVSAGRTLKSGYVSTQTRTNLAELSAHGFNWYGVDSAGTADVIALAGYNVSGGNGNVLAALNWMEFV